MIHVRRAEERGRTDWGWLDSRHSFSFGDYRDPRHMGFRALRVLNDDRVRPGEGFGPHGHADMEILSYVLEGALEHADSTGGGGVILPGEIQLMRAGTGIRHSESNHSKIEPVHFLQIWIVPDTQGLPPAYDQRPVDREAARRSLVLLASRDGRDASLQIQQDADLWMGIVDEGQRRELPLRPGRHAWVHVARGTVSVNGSPGAIPPSRPEELHAGDGAAVSEEGGLELLGRGEAEVLVFDLA